MAASTYLATQFTNDIKTALVAGGLSAGFTIATFCTKPSQYFAKNALSSGKIDDAHVTEIYDKDLVDLVKELAEYRRMKNAPILCRRIFELGANKSDLCTASALGNDDHGIILLSNKTLATLTKEELKAVIAHELEHIHEKDTDRKVAGIVASLPVDAVWAFSFWTWVLPFVDAPSDSVFYTSLGLYALGRIANKFSSRAAERRADRGAVEMTQNPWALSSGLNQVSENNKSVYAFINVDHVIFKALNRVFGTHPLINNRHKRLKQMAEELYAKYPERHEEFDQIRRQTLEEIQEKNKSRRSRGSNNTFISKSLKDHFHSLASHSNVLLGGEMACQNIADFVGRAVDNYKEQHEKMRIDRIYDDRDPQKVISPAYETRAFYV